MERFRFARLGPAVLLLGFLAAAGAQNSTGPRAEAGLPQLNISGKVSVSGRATPFLIRHLPVSSFPQLPDAVQDELNRRGCLIPQTFEAHQPENVVHGSFEQAGSSDWAALCSAGGKVTLLVFFGSRLGQEPFELASAPETERLQAHAPDPRLGFNWDISAASPEQVHQVQAALDPRPPRVNHDALTDSVVDHRTVYHFYANGSWTLLDVPEM